MSSSKTDQFPVGGILYSASNLQENEGWLLCDGRALNPADYKELFDVIKKTYNENPDSGQFNIPNYLGQFLRGAANDGDGDPDKNFRQPINLKTNNGTSGVATTQEYATKIPNNAPFRAAVNHLPTSTHVTHGVTVGSHTGPGANNPLNQTTCTSGGDKESRPINIYLAMYIKSSS